MAKSIHERVRLALEKKARDEQRAADRKHDAQMRAAERKDTNYERGVEAFERDGYLRANAPKEMQRGFRAASRSELDLDFAFDPKEAF